MSLVSLGSKRQKKMSEWDNRIKLLHKKYPRLKEISELYAQIALEMAMQGLGKGKMEMSQEELTKAQAALQAEKNYLLKKHNLPQNIYDIWWDCDICKDTGFIKAGVKCQCLKKAEIMERWQSSGLSPEQKKQTFASFSLQWYEDKDRYNKILKTCMDFAEKVSSGQSTDNILLYGTVGTGKTHLCSAIANYVLQKGVSVVYLNISKLLDMIREYKFKLEKNEYYDNNNTLKNLYKVGLLIIDDLGTENLTEFAREQVFRLLDERNNYHLPWVISTNLSPTDIGAEYEMRISDRIMSTAQMLKFAGQSVREQKRLNKAGLIAVHDEK